MIDFGPWGFQIILFVPRISYGAIHVQPLSGLEYAAPNGIVLDYILISLYFRFQPFVYQADSWKPHIDFDYRVVSYLWYFILNTHDSLLDTIIMEEIEKKYFTISEVAGQFDLAPSVIRFWESQFPQLRPRKGKSGARQYSKADIETLKMIYHLVKEKGYTLQGAKEALSSKPKTKDALTAIDSLKRLKAFLIDLKNNLPEG